MVGRTLNHYRIVESLGSGGMGEVFLAQDTRLNREVALKVLPAEMAGDPERRKRFEREAKTVASLNHPNIVTIYSVEEDQDLHFYTMERVRGKILSEEIPENGLPAEDLCRIAIPLVDAVSSAHQKGVTHRDLKPANVMVSDEGRVKVLDFGLVKLKEPASADEAKTAMASGDLTQVGRVIGTAAYMSPEQAEGKAVDERSDIFSLGILLYQMATGERPFKGETQLSLMSSILKDDPTSASDLNPALPAELNRIIQRCLQKDPNKRYSSAVELHDDLAAFKRGLETGELATSQSSLSRWLRKVGGSGPRSLSRGPLAVLSLLLLMVVLAGGYLVFQTLFDGALGPSSVSADRHSLAVFYFQNLTGDPKLAWLRTGLTDMLVTDLSQSPNLRVLGTDRLYQVLEQLDRLDEPQTSFEVVQAVARQAGIGTAVLGSFVKAGETLRINVRVQDTANGELLASERVEGVGEGSVFSMVDELTRRINRRFALASLQADQPDRDLVSVTTDSVEAYRYYVEGVGHHDRGDERKAVPLLERAVELDPDFAMAWVKLSVSYGNLEDWDKAREYAERALQHLDHLSDRERYYIEGRYYSLDLENLDQAVTAYSKAIELFPDHDAARNNLALIYLRREQYAEAITQLEALRRGGMRFPGTFEALATAYVAQGDYQKGYEVLQEFVANQPQNATGYNNLGRLLLRWGKYEEGIEALRKAESLDPQVPQGDLWAAMIVTERWKEAEAAARSMQGSEHASQRWQGYAAEGLKSLYLGRVDEAFARLEEAAGALSPDSLLHQRLEVLRILLVHQVGRSDQACQNAETESARVQGPDLRRELYFVAACACAAAGDESRARKYSQAFLGQLKEGRGMDEKSRQRAPALLQGTVALGLGDYEAAVRELQKAATVLPELAENTTEFADIWYGLGSAYWELGKKEEAARWFKQLVESDFERLVTPIPFVRSHYLLGKYHQERGESELARHYYQKFLDYWGEGQMDRGRVEEVRSQLSSLDQTGR